MGAPSLRYTVEFKQKAVELYRKSGRSMYVLRSTQSIISSFSVSKLEFF